jgi:hypothetical protein
MRSIRCSALNLSQPAYLLRHPSIGSPDTPIDLCHIKKETNGDNVWVDFLLDSVQR